MDLTSIVQGIESSGLGELMRGSLKAFPIVEAAHVMAVALVFGTILIVDLRLLGLLDTRRAVTRVSDELLRLTWAGFFIAVITGVAMFTANATTYFDNTPFQLKMLALLGAGINMAFFQFVTFKSAADWNVGRLPPPAARMAGALSILLWTSVIFLGRWIGFTKGYDFGIPEDVEFDFDSFEIGLRLLHDSVFFRA